nr:MULTISPECIES: septal ring lytic transglycosylase RlpA family protein [Chelativorans]
MKVFFSGKDQVIAGRNLRGKRVNTGLACVGIVALSVFLAGCGSAVEKVSLKSSKEYFPESKYGVKASPRVAYGASKLPRGGGRYQVGKPYQVKGRWYRPKEDPDYRAEGAASWYGDAFHGRLTANGEIYDMTHLTAAHPTMPLPSYARVTNMDNGSSVIVRVNDRGPFAKGRVIDLSKRAAELLDYTHSGVARVQVEYVGPAPLEGRDDSFLLASYRPGGAAPDPSDGLPTGVMVAMAGPTPTQPAPAATLAFANQPGLVETGGTVALPAIGPIVPDRPAASPVPAEQVDLALLSYANQRVNSATQVFDSVLKSDLDEKLIVSWWADRGGNAGQAIHAPYINIGTWNSREEAGQVTRSLSKLGRLLMEEKAGPEGRVYVLSLVPDGRAEMDEMLQAAWAAGATDAFAIRD